MGEGPLTGRPRGPEFAERVLGLTDVYENGRERF